MEGCENNLTTVDYLRFSTDNDYLWSCFENICKKGTWKEFIDLLTVLRRIRNIEINALLHAVNAERNGKTLMHTCARYGNAGLMRYLLNSGISVNLDNFTGWTALHEACKYNQMQVVQLLLNSGAKADACDAEYMTPLQCLEDGSESIKQLFARKLSSSEPSLPSLLNTACRFGDLEMVRKITAGSIDIAETPYYQETPLSCASRYGNFDIVKYLVLEANCAVESAFTNTASNSALQLACVSGDLEIVEFLHRMGANISQRGKIEVRVFRRSKFELGGKTPLHYACENNHLSIVNYLLSKSVEVSTKDVAGDTPLHIACKKGYLDIVRELSKDSTMTSVKNNQGDTAFDVAEHTDILDVLKQSGVHISLQNSVGSSQLHQSAKEARLFPKLKWIVENGGDVNYFNDYLGTPLHAACIHCNLKAVEYLIDKGANVNLRNKRMETPLHTACACEPAKEDEITGRILKSQDLSPSQSNSAASCKTVKVVDMLLEYGSLVEPEDRLLQTPIFRACSVGNLPVVKLLMERGASVNGPTMDETSLDNTNKNILLERGAPIHNACFHGFPDVVKLLLERSAEFHKPGGKRCELPIIYALNFARDEHSEPHLKILRLLTQAGAQIDTTQPDQLCAFLTTCRSKGPENIYARTFQRMVRFGGLDSDGNEENNKFVARVVKFLLQHNVLLPNSRQDLEPTQVQNLSDDLQRHIRKTPLLTTKLLVAGDFFPSIISKTLAKLIFDTDNEWQQLAAMALERLQTPRLFNISRRYLRRILGCRLEHKVNRLPLPARLKDCLLLRELDAILE